MRAVDVGVRHDNDPVITELVSVEVLPADAGAECSDQGAYFGRGQHLVESGLLDVENFAFQRKNGLGTAIAALFRGSSG